MKRALRIIIPLLLAVAVLACTAWYFLVYDQTFTKELLLKQARKFEDSGNYRASTWLYDLAYYQSKQDDGVAIELAMQYKAMGNYTKAEYTLSEAIAANPTAELYEALCRLYVEQDKLLDAVSMLDTVSNADIKAQLDAKRPQAPVLTPDSGFYSQYITVDAACDGGTLYLTTDGRYPSTGKDPYTGPITLSSGETVLHALCISADGLVSPLTVSGYTIGGVIEQVVFTDSAMEEAIRAAVSADAEDILFTDQLWNVTQFTIPAEAESYADLALLPYLTVLTVDGGVSGQMECLTSLSYLEELHITNTRLSTEDMDAIASRTTLQKLTLSGCSLSTIAALEPLAGLQVLDLSANTLRNISVLQGMPALEQLDLASNALTDLAALSHLTGLKQLDISYNSVSSLSPIYSLTGLEVLSAGHNQIGSISGIGAMTALQRLHLGHNSIASITALESCPALYDLDVSNNALTDVSVLSVLPAIRILNISYNQIPALPAFRADCQLVTIDASHNLLLDVEALTGLPWLNTVNMDYNADLESLLPLDSCPVLIKVGAFGTKVTEVSFLTDKSIIVNFDPTLEE